MRIHKLPCVDCSDIAKDGDRQLWRIAVDACLRKIQKYDSSALQTQSMVTCQELQFLSLIEDLLSALQNAALGCLGYKTIEY